MRMLSAPSQWWMSSAGERETKWRAHHRSRKPSELRNWITHFGKMSHPWPMIEPIVSQIQLCMFQIFSSSSASWLHGWLASQSSGAILKITRVREKGAESFNWNFHSPNSYRGKGWRKKARARIFTLREQTTLRKRLNKRPAWTPKRRRWAATETRTGRAAASRASKIECWCLRSSSRRDEVSRKREKMKIYLNSCWIYWADLLGDFVTGWA